MNRIGAALDVNPQLLVKAEQAAEPEIIARLGAGGAEALTKPMSAVLAIMCMVCGSSPARIGGVGVSPARSFFLAWV
jgi:hypothetical protein